MNRYFITATGTGVGKTLLTTTLCWQLLQQRKHITALKPVISGFDPVDMESDTVMILQSCGLTPQVSLMKTISPWQFRAPLAPSMAAAMEGKTLDLQDVVQFCRDHESLDADVVLAESAGGLMSPLTQSHTMLDWAQQLGWPVILVAGSYLGSMSHTLTALEVLKQRSIPVHALVVSESDTGETPFEESVAMLARFISSEIPVVKLPRIGVQTEKWKHAPLISWICT